MLYRIAQKFDGGKYDKFDKINGERYSSKFSLPIFSLLIATFLMKPMINSSNFCSSKFYVCPIHQIFTSSNFCAIQ